jgi:hypothetical protein
MTNDWIIDVLTDLRKFSASNSMERLAERLDDTILVASSELSTAHLTPQTGSGELEQNSRHAASPFSGNNA